MLANSIGRDARETGIPRMAPLIEAAIVILLVAELVAQVMTYPVSSSDDPDGYVTYAAYLREHHALMVPNVRLPGYPIFLALATELTRTPLPESGWWAQAFLMVVLAIVWWALTRRWFGPLPAAVLLAILAAPCFFTRMSVVMIADGPYSMLMLPVLLTIVWWALRPASARSWLWCLPFALGLLVVQAIRPTTLLIGLLLGPAIVVGYLVDRAVRGRAGQPGFLLVVARAVVIMVLAVGAFATVDTFLDTGARRYDAQIFPYRVVLMLPPAADSEADRRIEAAKARFLTIEGQPIESSRFLTYRKFQFWQEMPSDDVQAVWLARLMHAPGLYVLSVLQDLKLNHDYLISRFTPFFWDLQRTGLFFEPFPPADGSPASRIFYASGVVLYVSPDATPMVVTAELGRAVVKLIAVWSLLLLGCWQLARRRCGLTVTLILVFLGFVLAVAASNTADGRYLLPFAMFIYLAEAMGLAWIVQAVLRHRRKSPLRLKADCQGGPLAGLLPLRHDMVG